MKSHALNTCVNTSVNKTVALDLRIHSRAIENRIARTIRLHLRNRKWIANNVLRESLHILTLVRRDAPTLMHLKSRMHPTAQHARSIRRQQSSFEQDRNHTRAKQLFQRRVIVGEVRVCLITLLASAHHMKPSLAIKQSVDYQRVRVRMKVEIFAEGVDRNDDGRNAIVRRVANAACGTRTAEFFNGWARKRIRATETAKKSHKWSAVKSPLGAQTVLGDRHDPGFEV